MSETTRKKSTSAWVRKIVFSAMFLALALVLPFLTGQIPSIGSMLCPMHIPVLLCGFICGWPWGLAVGLIAPLLRSWTLGMPPINDAIVMTFELAAYGAVSGILYRVLPRKGWAVYVSLLAAMAAGRVVWGAARFVMAGLTHSTFPFSAFLAGAIVNAIPGIILQLVLIPVIVLALSRANLTLD